MGKSEEAKESENRQKFFFSHSFIQAKLLSKDSRSERQWFSQKADDFVGMARMIKFVRFAAGFYCIALLMITIHFDRLAQFRQQYKRNPKVGNDAGADRNVPQNTMLTVGAGQKSSGSDAADPANKTELPNHETVGAIKKSPPDSEVEPEIRGLSRVRNRIIARKLRLRSRARLSKKVLMKTNRLMTLEKTPRRRGLFPAPGATAQENVERIWRQLIWRPQQASSKIYTVLYDEYDSWAFSDDEANFSGCAMRNCRLTTDADHPKIDAVVSQNYPRNDLCPTEACQTVVFNMESQANGYLQGSANITATHLLRSDVPAPYAYYFAPEKIKFLRKNGILPHSVGGRTEVARKLNYAENKTKLVAWFVSNCGHARDVIARQLSKVVQVDIFGACGNKTCERDNPECDQMINRDYMFYLAFENSNCEDYITEKLFTNGLSHSVIPIYFGAPKAAVEAMVPPHSVIYVTDFPTVQELGKYLLFLAHNPAAYNSYFAWKEQGGKIVSSAFWCRLCAVLNQDQASVTSDLAKWWYPEGSCL